MNDPSDPPIIDWNFKSTPVEDLRRSIAATRSYSKPLDEIFFAEEAESVAPKVFEGMKQMFSKMEVVERTGNMIVYGMPKKAK